jgi:para-aminobenzoate synthetase/4-amino-4-deoxychorismate lyase
VISRPPALDSVVLREARSGRWLAYENPVAVLQTVCADEAAGLLAAVEEAVETGGLHAAGFLAYEAAPAFDAGLAVRPDDSGFPLLWFGLYRSPRAFPALPAPTAPPADPPLWSDAFTPEAYARAFERIKHHIREGDTYQVNLTGRLRRAFPEPSWPHFLRLAADRQARYGAYLATRGWSVCSASPELFFSLDGERLASRPMKGTAPRGLTADRDRALAAALQTSEKDRAENLMIVDMVRNDLGRIARPGSVRVPELFALEKYPTVWQMTSTVTALTRAPVVDIFRALFPPASITGAPKARTMALIADLEPAPRRIYTGAIGFLAPGRRAQFNVAIRTLLADHALRSAEYGVGSGVVWDSDCLREQAECRSKALILGAPPPEPFSLLESLRWEPGEGCPLLDRHLARLAASADYFDVPFDPCAARRRIADCGRALPRAPHKLRLLVAQDGALTLEAAPVAGRAPQERLRVTLARAPVDRADRFLYHKTTRRRVYEEALAARPGFDDVILYNAEREITESTRANVVVEIGGALCTPPVACGLLPGTFRAALLAAGAVTERIVTADDLRRSPRAFLVNSVRGWMPAAFEPPAEFSA